MIIHHVPIKKNRQGSFKKLVQYLTDPQNKHERVGEKRISNCHSIVTDWATVEIEATQAKNNRARGDKTYHLVISFAPGEHPSGETIRKIEDSVVESIGFNQHQRVSVVHHDTDNLHVHLAINKIQPTTYKMIEPYKAYKKLAKCAESLEIKYGLVKTNHVARYQKSENLANDMESHTGTESLINWIKKSCLKELISASSWSSFHFSLSKNGLAMKSRGNGFVIFSKDNLHIKASSLSRDLSKSELERKLGPFTQVFNQANKNLSEYKKMPLCKSTVAIKLFSQFQQEELDHKCIVRNKLKKLNQKKNKLFDKAIQKSKLKRKAINLIKTSTASKKVMHQLVSHNYKKKAKKIKEQCAAEKRDILGENKRLVWQGWLQHQAAEGNVEALAVLRQQGTSIVAKNSISGTKNYSNPMDRLGINYVTKGGIIAYNNINSSIKDNGRSLSISDGASQAEIYQFLTIVKEMYGKVITVYGSDVFKNTLVRVAVRHNIDIIFSNTKLDKLKRELIGIKQNSSLSNHIHM